MNNNYGTLYICPTPIGNLDDITIRVLNTLKAVDIIAAEDTRHTLKLLNHYNISKQLLSYHEHNEKSRTQDIIELLRSGKSIAIVSDAGTPLISDPGQELINAAVDEDINVIPLPGPSAAITALVASGLPCNRFCFEGFLPKDKKQRENIINMLKSEKRTIILYESPHHLRQTLSDLYNQLGNRKITIARELTKVHEEFFRCDLTSAMEYFNQKEIKGEFVLILSGNTSNNADESKWNNLSIQDHINLYIAAGMSKMDAIKNVAKDRKIPKREIYKYTIKNQINP